MQWSFNVASTSLGNQVKVFAQILGRDRLERLHQRFRLSPNKWDAGWRWNFLDCRRNRIPWKCDFGCWKNVVIDIYSRVLLGFWCFNFISGFGRAFIVHMSSLWIGNFGMCPLPPKHLKHLTRIPSFCDEISLNSQRSQPRPYHFHSPEYFPIAPLAIFEIWIAKLYSCPLGQALCAAAVAAI